MIEFTTTWMPYVNTFMLLLGGWFLKEKISHKNSQIETLSKNSESTKELLNSTKVLVEMYDIQKFKDHLDFTISDLEKRHRVEIEKVFRNTEEGVKVKILELATPWFVKYNELLNYQFHFLLEMSDEDLEKVYKLLPENKEFIKLQLKSIKETGNIKYVPNP